MNENVQKALDFVTHSNDYPSYGYMTLSRCKMDCGYYLGNGNRSDKYLYMGNPRDHIDFMKALWHKLPEKPQWLTLEQLELYERKMIEQ